MLYSAQETGYRTIILSSGTPLVNVHQAGECFGDHCPLHCPSNHKWRELPLDFINGHFVRLDGTLPDPGYVIDPDDYLYNLNGQAILRNSARCRKCGDQIVSRSQHEMVWCSCHAIAVDGGSCYLRRLGNMGDFEDTSVVFVMDEDR